MALLAGALNWQMNCTLELRASARSRFVPGVPHDYVTLVTSGPWSPLALSNLPWSLAAVAQHVSLCGPWSAPA
jgi:hypothetical protein